MTIFDFWLIYSAVGLGVMIGDYLEHKAYIQRAFHYTPWLSAIELILDVVVLWLPILLISEWRNK